MSTETDHTESGSSPPLVWHIAEDGATLTLVVDKRRLLPGGPGKPPKGTVRHEEYIEAFKTLLKDAGRKRAVERADEEVRRNEEAEQQDREREQSRQWIERAEPFVCRDHAPAVCPADCEALIEHQAQQQRAYQAALAYRCKAHPGTCPPECRRRRRYETAIRESRWRREEYRRSEMDADALTVDHAPARPTPASTETTTTLARSIVAGSEPADDDLAFLHDESVTTMTGALIRLGTVVGWGQVEAVFTRLHRAGYLGNGANSDPEMER